MSTYLITLADAQERVGISTQLSPADFNPHVLAAQKFGLRYVIGKDLYDYVIAQVSGGTPTAAVTALLPYLQDYLSYKVSALLLGLSSIKITGTGVVKKTTAVSEPVGIEEMKMARGTVEGYAAEAAKAITDFICDNQGDYPQYTAEGKFMQTYPGMGSSNFAPSPNT